MELLLNHIKNFYAISAEAEEALYLHFQKINLNKHDFLLREGQVCRHMYFLEQGALRGFYNLDGKEITHWFGFENDFVTSFHSFITGQPAVEHIQMIEPCTLWSIAKDELTALYDQHHDIERLVRIINENYYIRLEERFVNAQFQSAAERYENLLQHRPHIIERVSLGHIASYLGISQETLSRIRSRL